jgi:branched-chain amino acid transport system substrate-binding protein
VATYQQQGGKIGKQIWTPLGTADFGPLLTTIASEQPKFIYSFFAGSDAVRFLQQMREYRLAGRIKLVGTGALFDQEDVLPSLATPRQRQSTHSTRTRPPGLGQIHRGLR